MALSKPTGPEPVVLVTSGLHGVEGFVGSAVQLAALANCSADGVRFAFVHAVNPFGFAHIRRWDEFNVDLNRNFRLDGEAFAGAPPHYARLDGLMNPKSPPRWIDTFPYFAAWQILLHGLPPMRQAIAAGQYEYPCGLFFGGRGPSPVQLILRDQLRAWLGDARRVVHLDFHTGLGAFGTYKLLLDSPLTTDQRKRAEDWFGADALEASRMDGVAYESHGGFGPWCMAQLPHCDYLFLCAEFGTYGNVPVVGGLRAENRAHHWGNGPADPRTIKAKARLKELFCPESPEWRAKVLADGVNLIRRAADGLRSIGVHGAAAS